MRRSSVLRDVYETFSTTVSERLTVESPQRELNSTKD